MAFDLAFYDWVQGSGTDVPEAATAMFVLSRQLMFTAVMIGGWAILRKRLPWWWIGLSLVLCIIVLADYLSLAPLLALAGGVSPRLESANSDLVLMILLGVVASILTGLALWRRTRSQDRVIWAVVTTVMVATGTWFHLLFINGQMISLFFEEERFLQQVADLPEPEFKAICQGLDLICTSNPVGETYTYDPLPLLTDTIAQYRSRRPEQAPPGARVGFSGHNPDNTTDGPYAYAYLEQNGTYRVLVSRSRLRVPYNATAAAFMLQIGVAHVIWLFGGLAVMAGHRRSVTKLITKAKRRLTRRSE
ncbi:MAG: hypothetical protein Alpg2KO_19170 [Alphaproteobacteria bacterium]